MNIKKYYGRNPIIDYLFRKLIWLDLCSHVRKKAPMNKIYVVQRKDKAGFFSIFFYTIGHLMLAEKYGCKALVDWQSYPTPYNEPYEIFNTRNAWEYFFNQPSSGKIEEINFAEACCSEEKYPYGIVPHYSWTNLGSEGVPTRAMVTRINDFLKRNSILKREIIESFETEAAELNLSECLGVHIRGTDMKIAAGHNHPIGLEENMKIIARTLHEQKLKKIFLCTDEENTVERAREIFGDALLCSSAYRASRASNIGIHLETEDDGIRENHHYLLGREVFRDAYLLSKCRALVCGKSNVAYAAIVFNNNQFEKILYTN